MVNDVKSDAADGEAQSYSATLEKVANHMLKSPIPTFRFVFAIALCLFVGIGLKHFVVNKNPDSSEAKAMGVGQYPLFAEDPTPIIRHDKDSKEGNFVIFNWLVLLAIIGLLPALLAYKKGQNFLIWWFFGSFLFIIALPAALLLRNKTRRCPFCCETIKAEAIVCRFCRSSIPKLSTHNIDR